jgi:thioredoxin-dependent peroxiredoxin
MPLKEDMMKLSKGDAAPDFSLIDQNGAQVSLQDFKGKRLLLYFYPKANTGG